MKGKLCVITGATSGIGQATAKALAALGADLILIGRNDARGNSLAARLAGLPGAGKIEFLRTDLAAADDVHRAAAAIGQWRRPVEILVNNAGVRLDHYQRSSDGHELTFATNHLGHFLLTGLILEKILEADEGRIITVASGSHGGAQVDGIWELHADNYDRSQAYAKSKLANIVFAHELARRLTGTRAVSWAIDPGGVASNFARNNGLLSWSKHIVWYALRRDLISPRTAARAIASLASAPNGSISNGSYFYRTTPARSSPASYDLETARTLWNLSLALTGLEKMPGPFAG